jgi:Tripartite tricarboxylate transporter TctB family
MHTRNYKDVLGGILLVAAGAFIASYAASHYDLGTLNQMGPGMLPTSLGCILVVLGGLIAAPGLVTPGERIAFEVRPVVAVLGSIVGFALTFDAFGMIPAVLLLCILGALADPKVSVVGAALLAVVLALIAVGTFYYGLGIQMPLLAWPWS